MRPSRQSVLFAIVLVACATAFALPFRQPNCNTSAHYALVQTLAAGTPTIDAIHGESCDISWWHGHFYANKAPGLALVTVPWYELLKAVGVLRADHAAGRLYPEAMRGLPRRDLWLMGLWGAVLPALGLLLLLRSAAERLEPGSGIVVAAMLGFATLLLPFSSLFFSHVLAAFLAFAALTLVLETRAENVYRVAAAGALAGFGAVVEYPLAIFMVALGLYVVSHTPRIRLGAAFAAGVVAGLAPLAAYDFWAFGSPFHLSYVGAVAVPGVTGHDLLGANSVGFFGIILPRLNHALQTLFGERGLLTIGPVLALAPLGALRLWRNGRRREAVFLTAVPVAYVLYNACYYSPLGGATPGPRFLIVMLPFAVLATAPLVRLLPFSMLVLGICSATTLMAAHLTQPLISRPYTRSAWWHWVHTKSFTSTILGPATHGAWPAVVIVVAALAALVAAVLSARPPEHLDLATAAVLLVAWATAYQSFPHLARSHVGAVAIAATLCVIAVAARSGPGGVLLAVGAGVTIMHVHRHALLTAAVAVGAATVAVAVARLLNPTASAEPAPIPSRHRAR